MKYLLIGEETEKLKFRLLKDEDFESWINLFSVNNIAEFLDLDPIYLIKNYVKYGLIRCFIDTKIIWAE